MCIYWNSVISYIYICTHNVLCISLYIHCIMYVANNMQWIVPPHFLNILIRNMMVELPKETKKRNAARRAYIQCTWCWPHISRCSTFPSILGLPYVICPYISLWVKWWDSWCHQIVKARRKAQLQARQNILSIAIAIVTNYIKQLH